MSEMIVQVRNKMLRRIGGVNHFVSHNKDYTIQFQFDESWDNVRTKMAVFAYEDGEYGSEIFDGDTCNVPELPREGRILIGVKAGEDLSTELLCIPVCKSADDVITDEYDEPDPKIYEQILDIINNLWNGGTTVYPSPVRFLAAPSTAKVGDLIRVKEVDENGEIKETEAVDVEKELVVVNIAEDADGVLHADMTYDEINPLRYTHAVYAKWASGMYPYSTSARMYFGEDLKNVFVFSSSMVGMENWRIAIAQDGSVKINSYKLELVGRKVQTIDETTGTGDDSEKNYPSAKAVYDALANAKDKDAVKFVEQELTEEQKKQARTNIGAGTSKFSGSYNDLTNKPNIPAATVIDTTLSKSGQAADAKAAGDAIEKKLDATALPTAVNDALAQAKASGEFDGAKGADGKDGAGMNVTGAKVGQIAKITAVDAVGKPTAWEAVDMPSGGGERLRLVRTITLEENVTSIDISEDNDGNPFALKKIRIFGNTLGTASGGQLRINVANKVDDSYSILGPYYYFKGLDTTKRSWVAESECFGIINGKGNWSESYNTPDTTGVSAVYTRSGFRSPKLDSGQYIQDRVEFLHIFSNTSTVEFAAGSYIELWGVDA